MDDVPQIDKQLSLPLPRTPTSRRRIPRPFVKWVGGKSKLLEPLRLAAPSRFGRYFEPFVGGGALFFELKPERAVLTDVNEELINAYEIIRDHPAALVLLLGRFVYEKEMFYEVRAQDPRKLRPIPRAARTIYLNRTGFNGLYRVNKSGLFNVPFGRYDNPLICDADNLRACAKVLANAELAVRSFDAVLEHATAGDFVYFDPPYLPASDTADFTTYTPGGFGHQQHVLLAEVAKELVARKVHVVLSNADVPAARALYAGFDIRASSVNRAVSAQAGSRVVAKEIIVVGDPQARGAARLKPSAKPGVSARSAKTRE